MLVVGLTAQNLYVMTQLPGMPTNMATFGQPFAAFSGDVKCVKQPAVVFTRLGHLSVASLCFPISRGVC